MRGARHAAMLEALEGLSSRARRSSLDKRLPEDQRGGLTIIIAGPDKGDPGQKPPGGPTAPTPDEPQPVGRLGEGSRWRQAAAEDVEPVESLEDDEDDDDDMM